MVLKKHSNEIRSNEIRISRELPVRSNLDLRGFCFCGFIFVSPH
jgi:hypothetical protein